MHKLIHNLALFVVLYHLLVGCCWHHAHAVEPHNRDAATESACTDHAVGKRVDGDCHGCPHQQGHANHHSDQQRPGQSHRGCPNGHCVFVVPAVDGSVRLVDNVNPLANVVPHFVATGGPQIATAASAVTPPIVCSPLRLHLVYQILLI